MDEFEFKYQSKVTTILPDTNRTKELRKQLEDEENRKKMLAEKAMKAKLEEQKKYQQEMEDYQKQQKMEEDKIEEEKRRQQEEKQEINTLKGTFGNMINNLKQDQTPLEYTISGLSLLPAQIRIFVQTTIINKTLKNLSMTRKNIKDIEGNEIMKFLVENKNLQKLELEGNMLGVKTAKQLGTVLQYNKALRHIDMEGNSLTDGFTDNSGIDELAEGLIENETLLYLSLANCNLDNESGKLLRNAIEQNDVIIHLDLSNNPKMSLNDVRAIQDKLIENKQKYDQDRFKEFIERKRMKREEDISTIIQINQEGLEKIKDLVEQKIQDKKRLMEIEWAQKLMDDEIKRQKEIAKKEKETRDRLSKKGKKKKKKKKA